MHNSIENMRYRTRLTLFSCKDQNIKDLHKHYSIDLYWIVEQPPVIKEKFWIFYTLLTKQLRSIVLVLLFKTIYCDYVLVNRRLLKRVCAWDNNTIFLNCLDLILWWTHSWDIKENRCLEMWWKRGKKGKSSTNLPPGTERISHITTASSCISKVLRQFFAI